eukprot:Skav218195  [mRNA]  locus=scaffold2410:13355:14023:+ [translate_table: standard]
MSQPPVNLVACIGYAVRLSRRMGSPKTVTDHLQQSLHHLLAHMEDATKQHVVEPEAKRRRVLNLESCLQLRAPVCHSSCQTDGDYVDQAALARLLAEAGAKNLDMMNRHVSEFRAEIKATVDCQVREHNDVLAAVASRNAKLHQEVAALKANLREHEDHIAHLEAGKQPIHLMAQCAPTRDGLEEADLNCAHQCFLAEPDLLRLSQSSRFHCSVYGFALDSG